MNIVTVDCITGLTTVREMTKEEAIAYNADRDVRLAQLAAQEKAEVQDRLIKAKAELEAAKLLGAEGVEATGAQAAYNAALAKWQVVKNASTTL